MAANLDDLNVHITKLNMFKEVTNLGKKSYDLGHYSKEIFVPAILQLMNTLGTEALHTIDQTYVKKHAIGFDPKDHSWSFAAPGDDIRCGVSTDGTVWKDGIIDDLEDVLDIANTLQDGHITARYRTYVHLLGEIYEELNGFINWEKVYQTYVDNAAATDLAFNSLANRINQALVNGLNIINSNYSIMQLLVVRDINNYGWELLADKFTTDTARGYRPDAHEFIKAVDTATN